MKKIILKLQYRDDKMKQKAMQTVSGLTGVESIAMDTKDKKLTVIGDIDAARVVAKLRKFCCTEIESVGPDKEPEKKKEEPAKKADEKVDPNQQIINAFQAYYQQHPHYQYVQPAPAYAYHGYRTMEEDPNACVIC